MSNPVLGLEWERVVTANLLLKLTINDEIDDFQLTSDDRRFQYFDDIVMKTFGVNGLCEKFFGIQLKYKANSKFISKGQLTASSTGDFSLQKYFTSALQLSEHINNGLQMIVVTNATLNLNDESMFDFNDFQIKIVQCQPEKILKFSQECRCYKFEIHRGKTKERYDEYNNFFKHFFLYTNEGSLDQVRNDTKRMFEDIFMCSGDPYYQYYSFIRALKEHNNQWEILNKHFIKQVICLQLLSSFIIIRSYSSFAINNKRSLFKEAICSFNITCFKGNSEKVTNIWEDAVDYLRDVDEVNKIIRKYFPHQMTIVTNDVKNLDDIKLAKILWLMGICPLIVYANPVTQKALNLCPNEKFVLIGKINTTGSSVFTNLSDLSFRNPTLYRNVLSTFNCFLQGNEMNLEILINRNKSLANMITTDQLLDMTIDPLSIGGSQEILPNYYVPRYLTRNIIEFEFLDKIKENNSLVVISCNGKYENIRDRMSGDLVISKGEMNVAQRADVWIYENKCTREEFLELCTKSQKKIHHFGITDYGKLELIDSRGDMNAMTAYYSQNDFVEESELLKNNLHNNINIICDNGGSGMSTFAKSLKNHQRSGKWTIIIDLKLHFPYICEMRDVDINNFILYFLEKSCINLNEFDLTVVEFLRQNCQINFIWDGLDAIYKNFQSVMEIVVKLWEAGYEQWIFSNDNLKEILEAEFNVFSRKFKAFDDEERKKIIKEQLTSLSDKNVDEAASFIKPNNPLQLLMYSEVSKEAVLHIKSVKNLYYHYFDEKLKSVYNSLPFFYQLGWDNFKERAYEYYGKLAFIIYFEKDILKVLDIDEEKEIRKTNGKDNIVQLMVGKPVFLHSIYAEYFVTSYSYKRIKNFPKLREIILGEDKFRNVRLLLDSFAPLSWREYHPLLNVEKNDQKYIIDDGEGKLIKNKPTNDDVLLQYEFSDTFVLEEFVTDKSFRFLPILSLLINKKIQLTNFDNFEERILCSLLYYCVKFDHPQIFDIIQDVPLIEIGNTNSSLLHLASLCGAENCLRKIISIEKYKRFINESDGRNSTPLSLACKSRSPELVGILIKSGVDISTENVNQALYSACIVGSLEIVKLLIDSGKANKDESCVQMACSYGHLELVKYLISLDLDINATNQEGCTPLYIACEKGHHQVVGHLLESRAKLAVVNDNTGDTPLHAASRNGHQKVVELLIEHNNYVQEIDMNVCNYNEETPLHVACGNGSLKIVQLLVNSGANVQMLNSNNEAAIDVARKGCSKEIVKFLESFLGKLEKYKHGNFTRKKEKADNNDYEELILINSILTFLSNDHLNNFVLSSNNEVYDKFDDVIIEVEANDKERQIFAVQAKHSKSNRALNISDLTASEKGDFSLKRYFESFIKLNNSINYFILFTNRESNLIKYNKEVEIKQFTFKEENFDIEILPVSVNDEVQWLNTSNNKNKSCYKFKVIQRPDMNLSIRTERYKQFFERFFLFTDQTNVTNLENKLREKFEKIFNCDKETYDLFRKFINVWSNKDGIVNFLDKQFIKRVITIVLCKPFIVPHSFVDLPNSKENNSKYLKKAISNFDITFFEEKNSDRLTKLWGKLDQEFRDMKKINEIAILYQVIPKYVKDKNELDDRIKSIILWLMEERPLIVFDNNVTRAAAKLCKKGQFILLGNYEGNVLNLSVFRNLNNLDIKSEEYKGIVENFKLSLQGKEEIYLKIFIDDHKQLRELITPNVLIRILDGSLNIGEAEEIPVPYIDRKISCNVINNEFLTKINDDALVVISCQGKTITFKNTTSFYVIKIEEYWTNKNPQIKIIIYDEECSKTEFLKICEANPTKKSIHHLRLIDNEFLEWIDSTRNMKELQEYRNENFFIDEKYLYSNCEIQNINIICADPGMGKSILAKNLKNHRSSKVWTILINVKEHTSHFSNGNFNIEELFPYGENEIMLRFLKEIGRTEFIWDGLDELSQSNLESAIKIINNLSKMSFKQWLTSRSDFKEVLESKFQVFSRTLKPFDEIDQSKYIEDRLHCSPEDLNKISGEIKKYVEMIQHNDMVGIPLQIFMFTEIFIKDIEKYKELLAGIHSIADLYHHFVDKTLDRYCDEKVNLPSNDPAIKFRETFKNNEIKLYKNAALKALFSKEMLIRLKIDTEDCKMEHSVSIIKNVSFEGIRYFTHNTYGEYFVALYLKDKKDHFSKFKDMLFEHQFKNIRMFFDFLMAKDCLAHVAVLYKHITLLKEQVNKLQSEDEGGRNPLHLACSWGERYPILNTKIVENKYVIDVYKESLVPKECSNYKKVLEFLSNSGCDPIKTDKLLNINSLSYADKSLSLLPIEVLSKRFVINFDNFENFKDIGCILYYAVKFDYWNILERVHRIYEEIPFIETEDQKRSLLHLAALHGSIKCLKKILFSENYMKTINDRDAHGFTPLYLACQNRHVDIVRELIAFNKFKIKCDVNLANNDGTTPLHMTCQEGYFDIVKTLIESGADIDVKSKGVFTPMQMACDNGHFEIVQLLKKYKLNRLRNEVVKDEREEEYRDLMLANLILKLLSNEQVKDFSLAPCDEEFEYFHLQITKDDSPKEKLVLSFKWIDKSKTVQEELVNATENPYFNTENSGTFKLCFMGSGTFINEEEITFRNENFHVELIKAKSISLFSFLHKEGSCFKFDFEKSIRSKSFEKHKIWKDFYLYANQIDKLKPDILKNFQKKFSCSEKISLQYLIFIAKWTICKNKKKVLDKKLIDHAVAIYLLSPFMKPVPDINMSTNQKFKLFKEAMFKFNITFFSDYDFFSLMKILKNFMGELLQNVKEINRIGMKYQIIWDKINGTNNLNVKEKTLISWLLDKCPLVVDENESIYKAIDSCRDKKFILLGNQFPNEKLKDFTVFSYLTDLKSESHLYQEILKIFDVLVRGEKRYSLGVLLQQNKEIEAVISTAELAEMADDSFKFGGEKEHLPEPYISRSLISNVINDGFLKQMDEDTLVVISCNKKFNSIEDQIENFIIIKVEEFLVSDSDSNNIQQGVGKSIYICENVCSMIDFKKICERTGMNKCHHFKVVENGKLEWLQSLGNINDLKQYRFNNLLIQETELLQYEMYNNIHIICGKPGIGKSILFKQLKNTTSLPLWPILINVSEHLFYFRRNNTDINDFVQYILSATSHNYSKFDLDVLEILNKKQQISIFWDGLDEVPIETLDIILKIIIKLSEKGYNQWLSSRDSLKDTLENTLKCFSKTISEFLDDDLHHYLKEYLNRCRKEVTFEQLKQRIELFRIQDILKIPLELEIFINMFPLRASHIRKVFFRNPSLLRKLYFSFVEKRMSRIDDGDNEMLKKKKQIEFYEKAAMKSYLKGGIYDESDPHYQHIFHEIEKTGDISGIVLKITKEKITFIHNSYREYFAANYLFHHHVEFPNLSEFIFEREHKNIRFFFDLFFAENFPINLAVILNDWDFYIYNRYVRATHGIRKDNGGRNPLHLACSWLENHYTLPSKIENGIYIVDDTKDSTKVEDKYHRTLLKKLSSECDPFEVDGLFKINSISFADKSFCLLPFEIFFAEHKEHKIDFTQLENLKDIPSILYYSVKFDYSNILDSFENIPLITLKENRSLLHLAAWYGSESCSIKILKSSNYKRCITDGDVNGLSALHIASARGYLHITDAIINLSGAEVDLCDNYGNTPLHLASENGHLEIVDLLIQKRSSVNMRNNNGDTPIHITCEYGYLDITKLLIEKGTNINALNNNGLAPIYLACENDNIEIVKLLINLNANINFLHNKTNNTLLHVSCQNGNEDMVRLLINCGIEPHVSNREGKKPIDLAQDHGHKNIVEFLRNI